jgi:hypothetical protein
MGWNPFKKWFGTKKSTAVSSTIYSMAGGYTDKENMIAALILNNVLKNTNNIAEDITNSVLYGPHYDTKNYLNWCNRTNYKGNLITNIFRQIPIESDDVEPFLDAPSGKIINVMKTYIDTADITLFADEWLLNNDPARRFTNWVAEFFTSTSIKITFEDLSDQIVTLPIDYDRENNYLVCYYKVYEPGTSDALIEGAIITDPVLPDTTGYNLVSDIDETPVNVSLDTVVHVLREFSNSDPDIETTTTTSSTEVFTGNNTVKDKIEYLGLTTETTTSYIKHTYYEHKIYAIEENIDVDVNVIDHGLYTETVTTTTTTEILTDTYETQFNEQTFYDNVLISENVFIYRIGSGETVLDALMDSVDPGSEFYPIMPLRINNVSIKDLPDTTIYTQVKKAYKKLTKDADIDELLAQIGDNPQIGDIDYCFIHSGIPLNTTSKYELRYVYEFLKGLISYQNYNETDYTSWANSMSSNADFNDYYALWVVAQSNPSDILYGTPRPHNPPLISSKTQTQVTTPAINKLILKTDNTLTDNFYMQLSWFNISETLHTGVGRTGAKRGDLWWVDTDAAAQADWWAVYLAGFTDTTTSAPVGFNNISSYLYYQVDEDNYKVLKVTGLEHRNYVYDGKFTSVNSKQALLDPEKSDLIIPLHEPTLKRLPGSYRNEVVVRSHNLVFNSYQIVKRMWYQRAAFKILVIIIMITIIAIITISTGGIGTGPAGKTAAAIVAALGVAGSTAIVLTLILQIAISILATIVIKLILEEAFKLFFDDELAAMLATITTIVVTIGISAGYEGVSFTEAAIVALSDPLTVLSMTVTVADAALTYVNTVNQNKMISSTENAKKLLDDNKKIIEKNTELFNLEPKIDNTEEIILDSLVFPEKRNDFLTRSLVTGSDIRQITLSMVYDYVEYSKMIGKLT